VYGEKQARIMREEFGASATQIFLDEKLGGILKSVFYEQERFEDALRRWNDTEESASAAARAHLSAPLSVVSLAGEARTIAPADIVLELERAPRLRYGIAPVYNVAFGVQSEILAAAVHEPFVKTSRAVLEKAADTARRIEAAAARHFIAYPATMDYSGKRRARYQNETSVPPVTDMPKTYEG